MVPFRFDEAQERLKALVEFDVDIWLQPEREARVGQEKIPLWIRDYGYSQQGISFLIEKRQKWYSGEKVVHTLAVGDRIAVFSDVRRRRHRRRQGNQRRRDVLHDVQPERGLSQENQGRRVE